MSRLPHTNKDSTKELFFQYLEGKALQRYFIWAMCLIGGSMLIINKDLAEKDLFLAEVEKCVFDAYAKHIKLHSKKKGTQQKVYGLRQGWHPCII